MRINPNGESSVDVSLEERPGANSGGLISRLFRAFPEREQL